MQAEKTYLTYHQVYCLKNPERRRATQTKYQKSHLEVYNRNTKRYQARMKVWKELRNIDSDIFCY
jgi:hypothetical protein